MMRAHVGKVSILVALAWPASALAADPRADAAYERGEAALARGDARGAAASFEQAYRLAPHGVAMYSAGIAWEAAGETARAAEALRKALDSTQLDAAQAEDARRRLERLAPKTTNDGAADPSATAGDRARPPEAADPASSDADHEGAAALRTAGWITVGAAVAGAAAGGVLGWRALAARDEFEDSGRRDRDAHDRADALRTAANVTWIAAGVVGAAGLTMLIAAPRGGDGSRADGRHLRVHAGPLGASVHGRF